MSLGGVRQWLAGRLFGCGQPEVTADDPIARMIVRTSGRMRPARTYRWRLRGRLVNQFVGEREGLLPQPPRPRVQMGSLGRGVLFASLGLAISVSAVAAASSSALPGDPFYAVKRQVEELRMDIAPASVRPALAAMALEERLAEVEQLARIGSWNRVALGEQEVAGAVVTLQGLGVSLTADEVADLTHHTQVLTALLARAPAAAQPGLERALLASAGLAAAPDSGRHLGQGTADRSSGATSNGGQGNGSSGGGKNSGNNGGGSGSNSGGKPTGTPASSASPTPSQPPVPSQLPHAHASASPHPDPQPSASASPGT